MTSSSSKDGLDIVSVLAFCREDGQVLLNCQDTLASLPAQQMIKSSWRLTVRQLINNIFGLCPGREISIMRLTKFWIPDTPPVFHVLYKVKCTWNEKKLLKLMANMKWTSLDQVQQMSLNSQLSSPELAEYVCQVLQPLNLYPLTTDPQASRSGFDMLNEVNEKNIIVELDSVYLTPQEQLLKAAHFLTNEQKKLYKEFWIRTFPDLLMNKTEFEKFLTHLGWKKDDWPDVYLCAVSFRRGMTFRDFILFLAATEPDTPHGNAPGDIRCSYIFRYFDRNNDGFLDQLEVRALFTAIAVAKGIPRQGHEKQIECNMVELGLGSNFKMNIDTFKRKYLDQKLRGTSSIFRSKISVLKFVASLSSTNVTPYSNQSTSKNSSPNPGGFILKIPSLPVAHPINNVLDFMRGRNEDKVFQIATHTVRLTREGLRDFIPIDRVSYGKSLSLGDADHFMRFSSVQYYDDNLPENQLLAALRYFTSATPSKPSFNWGQFDKKQLISSLLAVCNQCIKVLEKEPRLMHVKSPIYILGDIHGNYGDLVVFEQVLWGLGVSLTPCSLMFLGDYVDRGEHGLETVSYLFAQKVKNPEKIVLIRGNHETRNLQKARGTFFSECHAKFSEDSYFEVWNRINQVFDVMPLAAVVDEKLFCCHGGIPPPWLCSKIQEISSIPCPLCTPEEESILATNIMWNDPVRSDQVSPAMSMEMDANEGFAMNTQRKVGYWFSLEALDTFLIRNNLSHVIRAHEVKTAGFQVQQGGKLLTVFSTSSNHNEAACIYVAQDVIRVFQIHTS